MYDNDSAISLHLLWGCESRAASKSTFLYKSISSISILGTIGVGLFFMISGYFTAHKEKTHIKKVCLITLFYAVLAILIVIISKVGGVQLYSSNGELVLDTLQLLFVPVTGSAWWYVTAYIVLMLIVPVYNRFLDKINEKGIKTFLLLLLVFGYTLGTLGSNFHDLEKALFFYTLGVFFKDYTKNRKNTLDIMISIIGIVLNGLCQYGIFSFVLRESSNAVLFRKALSMTGYLIAEPLACIGIFGLFSKMAIKYNSKINTIAKHTFGIYLLHEAKPLRNLIWIHILKPWQYYGDAFHFVFIIICVAIVFFSGCVIDTLREKVFEKPCTRFADRLINNFRNYGFKQPNN